MPSELVLAAIGAITEAVFGYLLDKSDPVGWLRQKLNLDAEKRAFERALTAAVRVVETKHPVTRLFDARDGAPILAQLLLRDGHPNPSELATAWTDALNIADSAHQTARVREWEPIAADLLEALGAALKDESALRELHNDQALEQMAQSIAALRTHLGADKATTGTRRDYLRWMMEQNEYLDPRGIAQTQRQVQLRLDEVYVSLQAQREATGRVPDKRHLAEEESEINARLAEPGLSEEEREEQREVWLTTRHLLQERYTPGETLDLASVVTKNEKLVITGEPGSGKSTLLRYLAFQHAQALWTGAQEVGDGLGATRFPILLRIAEYAQHALPKQLSLSDYLALHCAAHEGPKAGLADLLRRELEAGTCLVLLDGLDEIVTMEDRIKVVGQIEDFVRRHDNRPNHFIVTSRMAGYDSAALAAPFTRYTIQVMSEPQIKRFLERWTLAVESAQTPHLPIEQRRTTARREAEGIMKSVRSNPGVRRIAANPLLLVILALIHRTSARLPQKRIELYAIAAETLARDWRLAQGVPASALVEEEYLTPLLGKLAYWMHQNRPTGLATEKEVLQVLGPEWAEIMGEEWDDTRANAALVIEMRKFLSTVRAHTGLFVQRALNLYGFMHLTFEEYYAARYLVADASTRAQLIRQHLHDPRWEEPILLALGHLGRDYPVDAKNLLELVVLNRGAANTTPFAPTPHEDILGRDYLFLLRCLGDQIPTKPKTMQNAMERLADEMIYSSGSGRFPSYRSALRQRLAYLAGSEAATRLVPLLLAALDNGSIIAAQCLGMMGSSTPEIIKGLLAALHSRQGISSIAAQSLGKLGTTTIEILQALLEALQYGDAEVRSQVVESLGRLGTNDPVVVEALIDKCKNDTNRNVRAGAGRALVQLKMKEPAIVDALLAALKDPKSTFVRVQAAESLTRLETISTEVRTSLFEALRDEAPTVRVAAARSLAQLQGDAPTRLIEFLRQGDDETRLWVVESLGQLRANTNEVVSALRNALVDEDPKVRSKAAWSLGQLGVNTAEVTTALLETLHDGSSAMAARAAAESLGELGNNSPEVLEALLKALQGKRSIVRERAAWSLGRLGVDTPKIVVALLETLNLEGVWEVRARAAWSLGQLDHISPEVISFWLAMLQRGWGRKTRIEAAESLGNYAPANDVIIKVLYAGLYDPERTVCTACATALARLGNRTPQIIPSLVVLLRQALDDPKFERRGILGYSSDNVAFQALWQLLVGEG